jgi:hypothetical protein
MANEKFKIKGNKKIPDYDSEVEIEVDNKYEAYSKPIPDQATPLPSPPGGQVAWFNNFGIREKSTGQNKDVTYTGTIQALPAEKHLFVLYPGNPTPQQVPTTPIGNSGKVSFTLSIGDPPVGMGP